MKKDPVAKDKTKLKKVLKNRLRNGVKNEQNKRNICLHSSMKHGIIKENSGVTSDHILKVTRTLCQEA